MIVKYELAHTVPRSFNFALKGEAISAHGLRKAEIYINFRRCSACQFENLNYRGYLVDGFFGSEKCDHQLHPWVID